MVMLTQSRFKVKAIAFGHPGAEDPEATSKLKP